MEEVFNSDEFEYAGFWARFFATIIDTVIIILITLPLTMMVYGDEMLTNTTLFMGPADLLINYVLPFVAVILFWHFKSATPGKMLLKITIIDANDGGKLSVAQSVGRYFAYIPAMLPLFLGFVWVAFDSKKQGWHDKLAKTLVIKQK